MPRKPIIPDKVKQETFRVLKKLVEKYRRYGVAEIIGTFRGRYLYVDWVDYAQILSFRITGRKPRPSKLCRLRYTGDVHSWELEIYKYSDMCYDLEGDFPFRRGTVDECLDAAASLYITETHQ